MRTLHLTEHRTSSPVYLSIEERDQIRSFASVVPALGTTEMFEITPGSMIGAIQLGSLALEIRPKVEISRVMFLISYALDRARWRDTGFDFEEDQSLVEAVVPGFVRQVKRAFRRGLLQGYRTEEDSLATVRGRIRFSDQIRVRYGLVPPVEVRFDEFTEDIVVNRLIKAAVRRLGWLPIRSSHAREALHSFDQALATVSDVEYRPWDLPHVVWTRLNSHYRPAVELAKLILQAASFELDRGVIRSSAFLIDMNQVFEDFVVIALRDALKLPVHQFPQGDSRTRLDPRGRIKLQPDLSWWESGRCVFVGDAKYKRVRAEGINHPDLYQLLAYVIAHDLPGGLLVYAAGEYEAAVHEVVHLDRQLEVVTLDLSGPPNQILDQIDRIAQRVEGLKQEALNAVGS